jgi:WD40 repeat protein
MYELAVPSVHCQVLDEDTLQPLWEGRDSTQGISELDYSPNGRMLAAATFDAWIDVYNVEKGYHRIGEYGTHCVEEAAIVAARLVLPAAL